MFNVKHYDFLAKSFKDSRPDGVMDREVWERIVRTAAHDLDHENERFSFHAFYNACGLHDRPRKAHKKES